ncbi:MAG: hypothetical protein KME15_12770 [Drouetiella hepatica Uher 2000/2452]|uniref:Uncharacterized protein n=1 Tax=Drouetiella hepatica Uher 2000/2452 TaxID=904376 RepID=A0A951UMB7_9CYAN|nr:hypothetical protein [Drouetiella hepatica Uher 2000/2452]
MPTSSVVQAAERHLRGQSKFGSTVDRPFSQKTVGADGKNFMNVPAAQLGGVGVAIAHLQR